MAKVLEVIGYLPSRAYKIRDFLSNSVESILKENDFKVLRSYRPRDVTYGLVPVEKGISSGDEMLNLSFEILLAWRPHSIGQLSVERAEEI
jgi:hypothetical protein